MMSSSRGFGGPELLKMAKEIADLKGLGFEFVIKAVESAVQHIAHEKYGRCKILVSIDRKSGLISFFRELSVIDPNEKESADSNNIDGVITLEDARKVDANVVVGGVILQPIPPVDLDYASARVAKSKIAQSIVLEERRKQYEEFKERKGSMVFGTVDLVEYGNLIININGNEGCLPRRNLIGRETFRQGARVKAAIESVKQAQVGPQIFLSRVSNEFLIALFEQEIPEVADGIVKVMAVARDPGSRAKVAVFSANRNIDPVGACIGMRGNRVKNITNELNGEKVDVIEYAQDLGSFVVSALAVQDVTKIIIHEDSDRIDVVVPENRLNLAVGRRGQNVRLVSALVGKHVRIVTEDEESSRRNKELAEGARVFSEALDVEEIIGQLLVTEGFLSIENVLYASVAELTCIEGFSEDVAIELKSRAKNYIEDREIEKCNFIREHDMSEDIMVVSELSISDIKSLYSAGVKNLEDLADLSVDEFFEITQDSTIQKDRLGDIIMCVRKDLGWV